MAFLKGIFIICLPFIGVAAAGIAFTTHKEYKERYKNKVKSND